MPLNVFYFGVSETDVPFFVFTSERQSFCFQILIASAPQRGRESNLHKLSETLSIEGWQHSLFRKDLPSVIELIVHRLEISAGKRFSDKINLD